MKTRSQQCIGTFITTILSFSYRSIATNDLINNDDNENDIKIQRQRRINSITPSWSSANGNKGLLDTSYLTTLDVDDLEIQLSPNSRKSTFRVEQGIPHKQGFFHGVTDSHQTLNLFETPTGSIHASVVDEDTLEIHQIRPNALGQTEVITRKISDFYDESIDLDQKVTSPKNSLWDSLPNWRDLMGFTSNKSDETLDIMVVWTKDSECRYSGLDLGCTLTQQTWDNMHGLIELGIMESNTAYFLSGLDMELRLVYAYREPNYQEKEFATVLEEVTFTNDGFMDDLHEKRKEFGADLVSFWMNHASGCGLGWIGPLKDFAFSVVNWACATGYYSFPHEVAHNLGCRHDRGTENACDEPQPGFGYRDPQARFRSIMAYDCRSSAEKQQCDNVTLGSCARVQRFSNTANDYEDAPMGNQKNDCARHMAAVKSNVMGYFPAKTDEELQELRGKYNSLVTYAPTTTVTETTDSPIESPTQGPTQMITTNSPTKSPTPSPSIVKSEYPSQAPITQSPTKAKTDAPSKAPSPMPTKLQTSSPTKTITAAPTLKHVTTSSPTQYPITVSPTSNLITTIGKNPINEELVFIQKIITTPPTKSPIPGFIIEPINACRLTNYHCTDQRQCCSGICKWRKCQEEE